MRLKDLGYREAFMFRQPKADFEKGIQLKLTSSLGLGVDSGKYYKISHSACDVLYTRYIDSLEGYDVSFYLEKVHASQINSIKWIFDILVYEVIYPYFGRGKVSKSVYPYSSGLDYGAIELLYVVEDKEVLFITKKGDIVEVEIESYGKVDLSPSHLDPEYLDYLVNHLNYHFSFL